MTEYVEERKLSYDLIHSHYWNAGVVAKSLADAFGIDERESANVIIATSEIERSIIQLITTLMLKR